MKILSHSKYVKLCNFIKTAFFLTVSTTCFCLTVTYIHTTLEVRIPSVCPSASTKVRKFSLRFQGPKIFNSRSSEIQNASSTALFNPKLKSFFLDISTLKLSWCLSFPFCLVYFCIIFSHLFFLVFALTRSAFSIIILFNDFFLCSK